MIKRENYKIIKLFSLKLKILLFIYFIYVYLYYELSINNYYSNNLKFLENSPSLYTSFNAQNSRVSYLTNLLFLRFTNLLICLDFNNTK